MSIEDATETTTFVVTVDCQKTTLELTVGDVEFCVHGVCYDRAGSIDALIEMVQGDDEYTVKEVR